MRAVRSVKGVLQWPEEPMLVLVRVVQGASLVAVERR